MNLELPVSFYNPRYCFAYTAILGYFYTLDKLNLKIFIVIESDKTVP